MVAEFLHYYPSYKLKDVLSLYAKTFYTLVASMNKIKSADSIMLVNNIYYSQAGGEALSQYLQDLHRGSQGVDSILKEVRNIKNVH